MIEFLAMFWAWFRAAWGELLAGSGLVIALGKIVYDWRKTSGDRQIKVQEVDRDERVEMARLEATTQSAASADALGVVKSTLALTLPSTVARSDERDKMMERAVRAELERDNALEELEELKAKHVQELEDVRAAHAEERATMIRRHGRETARLRAERDELGAGHKANIAHPEQARDVALRVLPADPDHSLHGVPVKDLLEFHDVSDAWDEGENT